MIDQSFRILVAEDNELNMDLVCYMLENLNYPYAVAINGAEAVEIFKNENISAVLMDCHMPIMDGFQATSEIRRLEREVSGGGRVPILALTANAIIGDRQKCLEMDMDDYLTKPFKYQQLQNMLEKWLPRDSQSAELLAQADVTTEAAAGSETAIVNLRSIEALFKDPDRVRLLIRKYLEQAGEYLQDIRSAAQDGNVSKLRFAAHALKSSSQYMGLNQVAQTCKELELHKMRETDLPVQPLISRLRDELTVATPILRDY
jgi:CheY-like chemotaxis protein/HPt (histidine-containing phosphotransfer) domain-containing protein